MPLLRFLSLLVVSGFVSGCAMWGDAQPAKGCPQVYIVQQMSVRPAEGYTTRLNGVRDVRCSLENDKLLLNATLLTEIAVPRTPQAALSLPVPLTIAGVSTSNAEVVSRKRVTHTITFPPEDAPARTRPLLLEVSLAKPGQIGVVYVGLVGGVGKTK